MSKDPAFPLYSNDFAVGTQFFSDEQVGKYVRLLLAQHQHGHLTEKKMLAICKVYDEDIFEKFVKDSAGLFFNVRLEKEIEKRKAFSGSQSNKAQKRWKNFNGQSPGSATADAHAEAGEDATGHAKASAGHVPFLENENENENENEIKNADENENGKRGAGEKTKPRPEPEVNPFQGELAEAWTEWEKYRKQKRNPLTPVGRQRQVKLLKALTTSHAIEVINFSILNGYTGLFPEQLEKGKNGKFTNAKQQSDAQRRDYIANYYSKKSD